MLPRNYITESEKRKRQIDTLKIFNDNVTEITENSEYRLEFIVGKNNMHIDVKLSQEFPYEKPILQIFPPVLHPWVAEDSTSIVGAPGLINYTVHSDLGRIVQAIIREFEQKPPKLLDECIEQNVNQNVSLQPNNVMSPTYTENSPVSSFPELQNMSLEELMQLNDNIDLQNKFIEKLPPMVEMNNAIEKMMEDIEFIAKDNKSKRETLMTLKKSVLDRVDSMSEIKNSYESLKSKHSQLSSKYTPRAIKMALVNATGKADEEAESLAEAFLRGEIDCDSFLTEYKTKRKLGHTRRTMQEILSHQLSQFDKAT